jgi:predicted NAD/FAD-binding protein
MRIAVVGTGIAGNVAAWKLSREHDITVFEADSRVGGHTHTVAVESGGRSWSVDTGFIVFNDWTYPNFIAMLGELGVRWQDSDMSFSVRDPVSGLEYNGTDLNGLFAQRSNLLRPSFHRMVRDILRFNRQAPALLEADAPDLSLDEYLDRQRYSREFREHFILPMGAAIWSVSLADMLRMPARFFVRFFHNHGMLSVNHRPVWKVVCGGSRSYVERLVAGHRERIRLNTPVERIERQAGQVLVKARGMEAERFDRVFLACHSDQALAMLAEPTAAELSVLGAIRYQDNEVVLHTDTRLMPRRRRAWAAWNARIMQERYAPVAVTYNMNILQGLAAPETFLVTLNDSQAIDPGRVLGRYHYAHPVFTPDAVDAQARHRELNGTLGTYYCGAYWRNGFHEDGVVSALAALRDFEQDLNDAQRDLRRVG